MDNLKKYLLENNGTSDFNYPVPDGHERRFRKKLKKKSSLGLRGKIVAFGLSAAALLALYFSVNNNSADQNSVEAVPQLGDVSVELEQVEQFFAERINEVSLPPANEDPILSRQLQHLDMLDKEYHNLRKALLQNYGNHRVIDAMINNYQMRLRIMEQMKIYHQIKSNQVNTQANESRS